MADVIDPRTGELTTTNYGWTKPTVGASTDAWGGYLNADLDGIDSTVKSVSTVANAAQTSSQVDAKIAAAAYVLPTASTTVLGGVKVDGTTVAISGGGVISAAGAVAVSATAPSSPVAGSLWFDTNGGQMYVYYTDINSSQWVPVVNQGSAGLSSSSVIVPPPSAASWTNFNVAAPASVVDVANGVQLIDNPTVSGNNMRGFTLPSPATPYVIDANIASFGLAVTAGYPTWCGLGWTDGTKLHFIADLISLTLPGNFFSASRVESWTNSATNASSTTALGNVINAANQWFRIADDGTNVTFSLGADGVTYFPLVTTTKAAGFLGASGYTRVGMFVNTAELGNGGHCNVTLQSWRVH
jgi:hypothetical protein